MLAAVSTTAAECLSKKQKGRKQISVMGRVNDRQAGERRNDLSQMI